MIDGDVRVATAEAVAAVDQVAGHLARLMTRMAADFPLGPERLREWGDEPRERLHALLRLLGQLFDLVTRKLIRGYLLLSGETLAGMSAQNQFRRAEAIGGLPDANRWIELGATRNILAHDYSTSPVLQAARANRAWGDLPDLIAAARHLESALTAEGFMDG